MPKLPQGSQRHREGLLISRESDRLLVHYIQLSKNNTIRRLVPLKGLSAILNQEETALPTTAANGPDLEPNDQ